MSNKNVVEEIFTVPQLAERLSLDVSTVWRMIGRGEFHPVYRLTGRRSTRIPASAVNKFLATRTVTTEAAS